MDIYGHGHDHDTYFKSLYDKYKYVEDINIGNNRFTRAYLFFELIEMIYPLSCHHNSCIVHIYNYLVRQLLCDYNN